MHNAHEPEREPGDFDKPPEGKPLPEDGGSGKAALEGEPIQLTPPEQPRPSELGVDAIIRPDKRITFGESGKPHARVGNAVRRISHHRPHWPRFKRPGRKSE